MSMRLRVLCCSMLHLVKTSKDGYGCELLLLLLLMRIKRVLRLELELAMSDTRDEDKDRNTDQRCLARHPRSKN